MIPAAGMRSVWQAALILAAGVAAAAEEPAPMPELGLELSGAWQDATNPQEPAYWVFEPRQVRMLVEGKVVVMPVAYCAGAFTLDSPAGPLTARWKRDGDDLAWTLTLPDGQEQPSRVRRVEPLPAAMDTSPLPLPPPLDLERERIDRITAELRRRFARDQEVRKGGEASDDMAAVDADNSKWLRTLVVEIGWIDAKRFGKAPALMAFLLVQHSGDLRLMQAVLARIEADLAANGGDGQSFAVLYDRTQLMLGRKQRYGTQIIQNADGEQLVPPLEDRTRVDEFRKQIGLGPLADYLRLFGESVNFADDAAAATP